MKTTLAFAALLLPIVALAQSPTPGAASPSPAGQSPTPVATPALMRPPVGGGMLSPEERTALIDAAKKAQEDPSVKAASDKLHAAMKAARSVMIAKDPAVEPVLDKVEAPTSPGAPRPRLNPDEMQELRKARMAIKGTPEASAWQDATLEYRNAVRQVMMQDPAVAGILAKMPQRPGMGGPGMKMPAASATPGAKPVVSGS